MSFWNQLVTKETRDKFMENICFHNYKIYDWNLNQ